VDAIYLRHGDEFVATNGHTRLRLCCGCCWLATRRASSATGMRPDRFATPLCLKKRVESAMAERPAWGGWSAEACVNLRDRKYSRRRSPGSTPRPRAALGGELIYGCRDGHLADWPAGAEAQLGEPAAHLSTTDSLVALAPDARLQFEAVDPA
jgi:hypothetical protein